MDNNKLKSEATILMLSESLKHISEKSIIEALKEYYLLETTYVGVIKKQKFNSIITQNKLFSLFNKYFYFSKDNNKLRERRKVEKEIKKAFYSFLISPGFQSFVDKLFADESEIMYETDKYSIIKGIHKSLNDKIIKSIQNSTNYNIIPNFLIYYDKKLLNSRVNDIIKHQYSFHYTDKNQSKIEYKYLLKYYNYFSQNPNIIFEQNIFNDEFRKKIFKLIILCNIKFLKNNKNASQYFSERFINYLILMKLYDHYKTLNSEYESILKEEDKINEKELFKLKEEVKNDLFSQDNNNCNKNDNKEKNIIINNNDISSSLKLNKKYLKLLFSFSVLFNKYVIFKEINQDDKKEELNKVMNTMNINNKIYEIKIVSKLKCSSISRQMLRNVLNIFEEEKSFLYNYLLDTYVFENIIKNNNRNLYMKNREKDKIILQLPDILSRISKNMAIKTDFEMFCSQNKIIFTQPKLSVGFFGNLFNKQIPNSIKTDKGKEIYYNINDLKLIPIIKGDINSTQITIVIDGALSNDILLISNDIELSHKEKLCSFFANNVYTNSDFYCYDWQSINYESISQAKKVAKFYGKLLAYIIISREIFTFQTINLVGISIGCNIIKHCLLELNKINKKQLFSDIINNIVFIGGTTKIKFDKYPNIFESVNGKILNVFSQVDKDLIEYIKNSIGLNALECKDNYTQLYKIVNIDLSLKNIKQNDYIYQIPNILYQNSFLH